MSFLRSIILTMYLSEEICQITQLFQFWKKYKKVILWSWNYLHGSCRHFIGTKSHLLLLYLHRFFPITWIITTVLMNIYMIKKRSIYIRKRMTHLWLINKF